MSQFANQIVNSVQSPVPVMNVQSPVVDGGASGMSGNLVPVMQNYGNAQLQTSMTMQVNTESMVAIATAKAEQIMRKRLGEQTAAATALKQEIDQLTLDNAKLCEEWTQANTPTNVITFVTAASAAFGEKPTVSYDVAQYNSRTSKFHGKTSISLIGKLQATFSIEGDAPKEYLARLDQLTTLGRKQERLNRDILNTRAALSNVDSLERQARATIANKTISKLGQDGIDLVRAIEDSVTEDGLINQLSY